MVHKGKKAYLPKNDFSKSSDLSRGSKKAKIIVRNLPFKNLSEQSVEDLFKEYGEIEEVTLLRKENGMFLGCGFVQFKRVTSAAKAIRHANEKEILGRKIVVDWALPKKTFLEKIKMLEQNISRKDHEEVLNDRENNNLDFVIDKRPDTWHTDDYNSSLSGEESEDKRNESSESGLDEESDDEDNFDDDEDENNDKKEINKSKKDEFNNSLNKQERNSNLKPSDVDEGKTVFIRNIPFSSTNEDLKNCVESYGSIEYALICHDKLTEHSKGTGFVKFKEKDSAQRCIKDSNKIYLNENALTVTMALSKENLEGKKTSKKVSRDSRNLYLIREGVIIAGSKAAVGVSASDMAKRLQLEQWKNQILKNLNMFVSKTRLVIHNLPPSYDDTKLRKLFEKHSTPKAIIKEAKVMYHKKRLDATGKGVSKEVGFVSFTNHEDALFALRSINNNPTIFTLKKRPIVAFSIENKAVINSKLKRVEKSRAKLGVNEDVSDKLSKLNRKQKRFIKRREKFIERRKERKKLKQNEPSENTEVQRNENNKRKRKTLKADEPNKKLTIKNSIQANEEPSRNQFTGVISESEKKTKLRSKFRLKNQIKIHRETLKKERQKRREKEKKKMTRIKFPKEKKKRSKLIDDAALSKLLKKHRKSVKESSFTKKWYDE